MLFHLSIDAREPRHVASVIAELFGNGTITPFPPVSEGSWLAMAGDDRNTMVEVYPRGTVLEEVPGDADAVGNFDESAGRLRGFSTHFAMGTRLPQDEVMAIAAREGWPAKYRSRAGLFGVIEMWIEGERMIEVLTQDMQDEYLASMSVAGWTGFLAANAPA
ncbi:hypothetical protein SZ64_07685 [Erythrobacter sp. SG61-1L]|uniref:hypothetical protein n=1 Tax=Erythrobacter sp. SG61-1L TaxID=1603897 RepID=UPI0006C927DD|nr:hypothetical protein [Erythrobacter sp. SG61-1L]KPL68013.1 hypothetical protein SZ64_07685 [Erythrobacter sp. SG61-1L]